MNGGKWCEQKYNEIKSECSACIDSVKCIVSVDSLSLSVTHIKWVCACVCVCWNLVNVIKRSSTHSARAHTNKEKVCPGNWYVYGWLQITFILTTTPYSIYTLNEINRWGNRLSFKHFYFHSNNSTHFRDCVYAVHQEKTAKKKTAGKKGKRGKTALVVNIVDVDTVFERERHWCAEVIWRKNSSSQQLVFT